jgi:hypothetical protein
VKTLLKRAFGLVTLLVGLTLLVFGLGQPWLNPRRPFQIGPLVGGLFWGFLGFTYGRKWLFNLIDMNVIRVDPQDPVIQEATRRAQASFRFCGTT